MEIEPVENLSINSEELIDNITKISALYEELLPQFSESFIFYGETLHDWSAKMVIKIPDNAKPPDLQTALIKLIHAIGMASHYKTVSSNLYTAITSSTNAQRNTIISNIVNETKNQNARRPAKDIIESMAEDFLKDIRNAELVAKIYKDFWTQKLDALIEIRKCIEQMNFSITTEMKYLKDNMDTHELLATLSDHPALIGEFLNEFRDSLIANLEALDLETWNEQDWLMEIITNIVQSSAKAERSLIELVGEEVFDAELYFDVG